MRNGMMCQVHNRADFRWYATGEGGVLKSPCRGADDRLELSIGEVQHRARHEVQFDTLILRPKRRHL